VQPRGVPGTPCVIVSVNGERRAGSAEPAEGAERGGAAEDLGAEREGLPGVTVGGEAREGGVRVEP
jgi:hypothetical protein